MPGNTVLRNRMTGETRDIRSVDDLRRAYGEFSNPARNLRVLWSRSLRGLVGLGRRDEETLSSDDPA